MSQMTPEFALGLRAVTLGGFKNESQLTRKVIAAVPDAKSDYKPDPHARNARELAWHIASSEVHFADSIADLKFDITGRPPEAPATIAEIIAWRDQNLQHGLARLEAMSAEQLMTPIAFAGIFNLPAVLYLGFLNNHSIHHRGELATYLRPMGSKVPSIYGGSYDEPFKMTAKDETAA